MTGADNAESPAFSEFTTKWHRSLDPVVWATDVLDITPDPWQAEVLRSKEKRFLLNCTRQGGKSTVAAILALHIAIYRPESLILIISPSGRQSAELFDKIYKLFSRIPDRPRLVVDNVLSMELPNRSRIIALPDSEDKIRGYSDVDLIIEDESARVPDETHDAVQPMLIVSDGRYLELSTPKGKKNHFYRHWADKDSGYRKIMVTIDEVPRISEAKKAELLKELGSRMYRQECMCEFLEDIAGEIIKREWLQYYQIPPTICRTIHSWDTAFKKGQENDWSVCEVWGEGDRGYYLLDIFRARVEFPELKRTAVALYERDHPSAVLIEDSASGQSLLQELTRETKMPLIAVKVDRDKIARTNAVTPLIESGRVFLPEAAPWLYELVEEWVAFPGGEHDDQVDPMTQGLVYLQSTQSSGAAPGIESAFVPSGIPSIYSGGIPGLR